MEELRRTRHEATVEVFTTAKSETHSSTAVAVGLWHPSKCLLLSLQYPIYPLLSFPRQQSICNKRIPS